MSADAAAVRTRGHLRIWGAAAAAAAFLLVLASALFPAPFRHEGRTVKEWLWQLDGSYSGVPEPAVSAFETMGSRAIPGLSDVVRERPWSLRVRLREAWHRWIGGPSPWLTYNERQARAVRALLYATKSPETDIALLTPHLQYHLTERSEPFAALVLTRAGPDGIACLTNLIWTGRPAVRDFAGFALSQGPETQRLPGVKAVLTRVALAEEEPQLRSRFLLYLSLFEPDGDSPVVVPLALDALTNTDGAVRRSAVELLGRHRADPRAVPALRRAVDDPEPAVGAAARRLLGDGGAGLTAPR